MPLLCEYAIGMDTEKDAIAILHDAERSLRGLIHKRLTEQRYNDVASIARLADSLSQLLQPASESPSPQGRGQGEGDPPLPVVFRSAQRATSAPPRKSKTTIKKKEYPKFVREGDRLVKIGWSKTNKTTYEHKAPYEAVTAVVRQLSARVTPGKTFTIEDVVPVPDISNNGEVPVYQVYLTLAWLRSLGLVVRKAKDGYVAVRGALESDRMGREWDTIHVY